MATWNTDVMGLAKHAPTPRERGQAAHINRRWREWQPLLEHELRVARRHSLTEMERLRQAHMHAALRLYALKIPLDFVTDTGIRIDDPRIDEATREGEIERLPWATAMRHEAPMRRFRSARPHHKYSMEEFINAKLS